MCVLVLEFYFLWVPPQHWKRRRCWAHAACFALPRWLTVHDNAPRATNALATMPAMWNLRTQRRPRNTLPRQQQQLTLGSTFDVRSMSAVAVAQWRRQCDEATHQEGTLNTEAQKVGERDVPSVTYIQYTICADFISLKWVPGVYMCIYNI